MCPVVHKRGDAPFPGPESLLQLNPLAQEQEGAPKPPLGNGPWLFLTPQVWLGTVLAGLGQPYVH